MHDDLGYLMVKITNEMNKARKKIPAEQKVDVEKVKGHRQEDQCGLGSGRTICFMS